MHRLSILISIIQTFFLQAGITSAFLVQSVNLLWGLKSLSDTKHYILLFRIIIGVVGTSMATVGVLLIDRMGRRRLLLMGAIGMCVSQLIIAIVGVTAGHVNPVTQAVNIPAQKVLIAFVCMCGFFFFRCS